MTTYETFDALVHGQRVRRLLESHGYCVASVATASGNIVAVVEAPSARRDAIAVAGLKFDPELHWLAVAGRIVDLTAKETVALHTLLLRAGAVVPQHDLIVAIWPDEVPALCKNRLYTLLCTLRRKLVTVGARATIHNTRRGYRLVLPEGT